MTKSKKENHDTMPNAKRRWFFTILILPLNVLIFIPMISLWLTGYKWKEWHELGANNSALIILIFGCVLMIFGIGLAAWTMRLFHVIGKGTAAPWDPPKNLVIDGPYCYVRNPMLTSVFIMLIAESLLLNSWAIFILFIIFFIGNIIYFKLVEEKELEKRFGKAYLEYKRNVPRLIPRLRAWHKK